MGDTVYEYVMVGNSPPVTKYTAADAGQTTVMDNIAAAGDVEAVVILNRPSVVEFSSPTIEIGQSFVAMVFKSSTIIERVLFEESATRLAFIEFGLSQWSAIPVALGIPVQPEVVWREDQFEAATNLDRVAIQEIEAAPDVQTRTLLQDPLIQYVRSPSIRVNEVVVLINVPETTKATRVYVNSALGYIQFIHKFLVPISSVAALVK